MGRFLRQSRVSKPTVRNPSALFAAFPFKSPFNVLSNPERELLSAAPFLPVSPRELLFPRNRRLVTAARKKPSCPLCKNCMVLRIVCKRKAGRALNTEDQVIPGLYGAGHGVAHCGEGNTLDAGMASLAVVYGKVAAETAAADIG